MNERRVNYDEVAVTYDDRYASGVGEAQHTIPAALRQLLRPDTANQTLEVGCGTGFWLGSFGIGHEVYGLDLSSVMLARARKRHLVLVCGSAEQLPFPDSSFDLVYCVNAFHHFQDKNAFLTEGTASCDKTECWPSSAWTRTDSATSGTSMIISRARLRRICAD